ncbi:replication initiation protein [Helicobacter sp. UBA3407]|uniref:replication initiation protein n=1 Tax=Helicobacter TaxID=209 RepID=UPI002607CC56|nr:replication initiation protein [Helicobacter sp. UBA3407]
MYFTKKLLRIRINIFYEYKDKNQEYEKAQGESIIFLEKYNIQKDENNKTKINFIFNEKAMEILFRFNRFTEFDLNEFCSIKNKYTKTLSRLLKQYENVNENPASGLKNIVMEKQEFLEFMNLPNNCINIADYTNKRIMIPAIDELNKISQSFKNVSFQKIKEGGMIKKFEISFQTIR